MCSTCSCTSQGTWRHYDWRSLQTVSECSGHSVSLQPKNIKYNNISLKWAGRHLHELIDKVIILLPCHPLVLQTNVVNVIKQLLSTEINASLVDSFNNVHLLVPTSRVMGSVWLGGMPAMAVFRASFPTGILEVNNISPEYIPHSLDSPHSLSTQVTQTKDPLPVSHHNAPGQVGNYFYNKLNTPYLTSLSGQFCRIS